MTSHDYEVGEEVFVIRDKGNIFDGATVIDYDEVLVRVKMTYSGYSEWLEPNELERKNVE